MEEKNIQKTQTSDKAIDKKTIASFIGEIASEVYGVVGLTKSKTVKNQLVILKRDNYSDGIIINNVANKKYDIEVHLIVAYGVKITEVVNEVRSRIKYFINKEYGLILSNINVYVEDLLNM